MPLSPRRWARPVVAGLLAAGLCALPCGALAAAGPKVVITSPFMMEQAPYVPLPGPVDVRQKHPSARSMTLVDGSDMTVTVPPGRGFVSR
ncbi:hypothetical protein [Nonomuraea typhae]|uniref:Uncharacterized protein n=1 Tax=Nonomuraea typhae TaxID=2603600 RepID=A0ABW7YVA6_9ACTN